MRQHAQKLHQKVHNKIDAIEVRIRAWQIHNKPLFYALAAISWLFSTLAAGAVLDLILPILEGRMAIKIILWIIGAFIFLFIFVLAIGQKRKKGFLFWYPWIMVFMWALMFICAIGRQAWMHKTYTQHISDTNTFYLNQLNATNVFYQNSTNFLVSKITGLNGIIGDLKQQVQQQKEDFNEAKREQEAKIEELTTQKESSDNKLAIFEANPERWMQIYSNLQAVVPTNFNQYYETFSRFSTDVSNLNQLETGVKMKTNVSRANISSQELAEMGIEKLPDGRTKVGGMLTGSPTVVIDAYNEGVRKYTNRDFVGALTALQSGIRAMEATKTTGIVMSTGGDITPQGKGTLYTLAAECAMQIHSNDLAIQYAQSGVDASPQPGNKLDLTFAFANSAWEKAQNNDASNSFRLINMAITNYESIESFNLITNSGIKPEIAHLYGRAVLVATYTGHTNQSSSWLKKLQKISTE